MKRHSVLFILIILCVILLLLLLCVKGNILGKNRYSVEELYSFTAEEMVIANLESRNEKNIKKYEQTLSEKRRGATLNFDDFESWKLISIEENELPYEKKELYKDMYDVKYFKVVYEVKWIKNPSYQDGVYQWFYTVIKPSKNERWYIDSYGFA